MRNTENVSLDEGRGIDPLLIDPTNYAKDEEIVKRVQDKIISLLDPIRTQRQKVEELWDRYYKVWAAKHQYRLYEGRSDLYFPIARKIVETHVAALKLHMFPASDSFWVAPLDPDAAMMDPSLPILQKAASALLRHGIETARVGRWMDMFIRQGLIFGTSVVKSVWNVKQTTNYKLRKKIDALTKRASKVIEPAVMTLFEGPTFKVVNLLDWYIHPITCTDIDDARMIFEDVRVDWSHLKSMEEEDIYHDVQRVKDADTDGTSGATKTQGKQHKDTRNASYGISVDQVKEAEVSSWVLTEIWCHFDLNGDGEECACKVVVCNGEILEIRQNPTFQQRPPYFAWKVIDLQDFFYGQGLVESIEHHQYALNAMLNQTLDAVIFQTNHIIAVNTSLLAQAPDTLRITPRAIWKTLANPAEVIQIIRPPDNSQAAFNTANLISTSMQDTAGAPPVLQGKLPSKEVTAEEVQTVNANASGGQDSMVTNLNEQVMTPLLHSFWAQNQQFRSDQNWVRISGQPPLRINEDALCLDWQFRWLSADQIPPMVKMLMDQKQAAYAMSQGQPQGGQGVPPGGTNPNPNVPQPTGTPGGGVGTTPTKQLGAGGSKI